MILERIRRLRERLAARILRLRIGFVVAVVSILTVGGISLVAHTSFVQIQEDQARSALLQKLEQAVSYPSPAVLDAFGGVIDDPALPAPVTESVRNGNRVSYIDRTNEPTLWVAQPYNGKIASFSLELTAQRELIASVDNVLVIASVSIGLLAVGFGLIVGSLSNTLRRQVEFERRISADMAHELRTPLTGLVTAVSLLEPSRPAEIVQERVSTFRRLVEDILIVSRLQTMGAVDDSEPLALAAALRTIAVDPDVTVVVEQDMTILADPRRLERIIANAVDNARVHGRPPITVRVDGPVITIADQGPGFTEEILRLGPSRFTSRHPDRSLVHGLGLSIAQGQARAMGAELTFANSENGGAVVRLYFPKALRVQGPVGTDQG